jgi:Tol biopolymer transport system component
VFASEATNLVRRPGNGKAHIYLRDLMFGRTSLLDVGPHGELADQSSWDPMISRNGRYVVFFSDATNLVGGGGGLAHIYLRDLWAGTTTMVDVDGAGRPSDRDSIQAQLSPDGRAVVFMSRSTNLAPGRTGDTWNVFLRDLDTRRTILISAGMNGAKADGLSYGASIDRSHRWVSFASLASNLVPGDTNHVGDVFLRDVWTGRTTRVSVGDGGVQGDDLAVGSSISADGRFVGFASHAKNLRPGLSTSDSHAYVRDVVAGRTISADSNAHGEVGNAGATWTAMSADGRSVLFQSQAANLLPAAPVSRWNVYRRDLATGELTLVSTTPSGGEPNGESWWPTSSGDGRLAGFLSFASDVRPGDTNGFPDIYVKRVR